MSKVRTEFSDILEHTYWRHRIDLGEGEFTPGTKFPTHWDALGLPEDMSGLSFLDIGAFDGMHSFEAERRGADYVLATDVWDEPSLDEEWWNSLRPGKKGFDLVHSYIQSDVDSKKIGIEDISPDRVGKFDVVLCSGVIYHLKEPLSGLENAYQVSNNYLVCESAITNKIFGTSGMEFFKSTGLGNNPSNWWVPNPKCLEDMLRSLGLEILQSGPPPLRESEPKLPDIRRGILNPNTKVFISPKCRNILHTTDEENKAKILMDYGSLCRVEYRHGTEKEQGWVFKENIDSNISSKVINEIRHMIRENSKWELPKTAIKETLGVGLNSRHVVVGKRA